MPDSSNAADPTRAVLPLRVATLNVWALPEPLAVDVGYRLTAIGRRLADLALDVVAFQEAWTSEARSALVHAGRAAGLVHAWEPRGAIGSSGLLVISRLPIQRAHFESFRVRGLPEQLRHIDFFGGKGFVVVTLETELGPIHVVDTHLQARYRKDVAHGYRSHRVAQVVQLATRLRELREPLLLLGDLNCEAGDPEYEVLVGLTGLVDAGAESEHATPTVWPGNAYRRSRKTGKRVDFVMTRPGTSATFRVHRIERELDELLSFAGRESSYSNHAAVRAELTLDRGASAGLPSADAGALALADQLLGAGRREAARLRREDRWLAGAGVCAALAAGLGSANPRVSRRRLLRYGLSAAAAGALPPGLTLAIFSEVYAPAEIAAFDLLAHDLHRVFAAVDESSA